MSLTRNLVVAFGFAAALGSQGANATCGLTYSTDANGGTVVTGSPCGSPNPTQPPVIHNGGAGGAGGDGGAAAAQAAAQAAAHSSSSSAGGSSTIQAGAVKNTNNVEGGDAYAAGGKSIATVGDTIAKTGPIDNRSAGGVASNGNQTTSLTNIHEAQKQAASSAFAPALITASSGDGKLRGYGLTFGFQVFGGGATGGYQSGEEFSPEHADFVLKRELVRSGVIPGALPAMAVIAVRTAGGANDLAYLRTQAGQDEMRLFSAPAAEDSAVRARSGNVALNQHFYAESATATQPQFVCRYVDKKTGDVKKGEIITVQGQLVCKTGGDAPAP